MNHIKLKFFFVTICNGFFSFTKFTKDLWRLVEVCCQSVNQWELMMNLVYSYSWCPRGFVLMGGGEGGRGGYAQESSGAKPVALFQWVFA